MIEAVIFDIGGVLAEDVWEHLLPCRKKLGGIRDRFGLDHDQVDKIGVLLWAAFAHTPEGQHTTWRELERRYWDLFIRFFWDKSPPPGASIDDFIELTDKYIKLVDPEIPALLESLQSRGLKLGICSNNNEFWFRRQLGTLQLFRYFPPEGIVLSCRVGFSKSSPGYEMFDAAARALNVPHSSCIFVDDREENIKLASACGMKGIHFHKLSQLKESLNNILDG
ncbi:MAG: HAD family phosphatase [Gallionellaceae bacterium]|nr:HAD family phosphatase [Gallionellaceae bacterium]